MFNLSVKNISISDVFSSDEYGDTPMEPMYFAVVMANFIRLEKVASEWLKEIGERREVVWELYCQHGWKNRSQDGNVKPYVENHGTIRILDDTGREVAKSGFSIPASGWSEEDDLEDQLQSTFSVLLKSIISSDGRLIGELVGRTNMVERHALIRKRFPMSDHILWLDSYKSQLKEVIGEM